METAITDAQISTLRDEAGAAGDLVQVAICDVALCDIAAIDESVRSDLEGLGILPERVGSRVLARVVCADVIRSAAAMDDDAI